MSLSIQVGNAPCSWGTLEFEGLEGDAIGYRQMLDELVDTGYTGTELGDWGYMPTNPDELHDELASRRLSMLGAFVPVALMNPDSHSNGIAPAIKTARLITDVFKLSSQTNRPFLILSDENGASPQRTANAGRITPELGLPNDQWNIFTSGAEQIASAVKKETGLSTVFHHHCAGHVETPEEIDEFLKRTDPDLIQLVFDTGHYVFGAGDYSAESAVHGLDRFAARIGYIHFKDCSSITATDIIEKKQDYFTAVKRGVFCQLGHGCVDFQAVVEWLEKQDYRGWVLVEQDVLPGMGQPKESALNNRDYLKSIGI